MFNNIFLPAINQIFYVNKENLVYSKLIKTIFNENKIDENLFEFLLNFNENVEYEKFKKIIELKFNLNIKNFSDFFCDFVNNKISFVNL